MALYRPALETNVGDVLPAIHVPTLVAWRSGATLGDAPRDIVGGSTGSHRSEAR
ncbi:MAG: hypothetical protein ACRDGV_01610 [Candidatus Limnocylindria bacterium]